MSPTGTVEALARRCRIMDMMGAIPDPPASISTGPPSSIDQVKGPPIGPRISISSPDSTTSWKNGDTSPSGIISIAISMVGDSSGAEAIE